MVMTPAMVNLAPASMILEAVSAGPIRNSSYAILMAGDALPQRMQQKRAAAKVTGNQAHMALSPRLLCFNSIMRSPWYDISRIALSS